VNDVADFERVRPVATDGEIAAINLESSRRNSWRRFLADPRRDGLAEAIVEEEMLAAQYLGDLDALDRMAMVADELARADGSSGRTALVQAQVASAAHRFADATQHLAHARVRGVPSAQIDRQALSVDQACGTQLHAVLDARRRIAAASGSLDDLVPLGALLADLERFDEADGVYRQALDAYDDVSPFPLAWVCFQRGMLWGELASIPDTDRAASWYRRAIEYLPGYVKARVHLAEICARGSRLADAEALLVPALPSGDPEVPWRLADVLLLQGKRDEAATQLDAARSRFEELLARHPLAFADHAAEFYAGSGGDPRRALELARANAVNRPTRRAVAQVAAIEQVAGALP
jgi:tetratricopeptide (TPR) repeat protein